MPIAPAHNIRGSAVLLGLVLAAACGPQVESAVFVPAPALREDHPVRVYRSQAPACAYDEVGIVSWSAGSGWNRLDEGVDLMRTRAAEMGGDAIVDFQYGESAAGLTTTTTSDSTSVRTTSSLATVRRATGTVVRFTDRACADVELRVAS